MRRNTHCQELLQWNKQNEQQLHIHVKLRNLGNQPGKTPMCGNQKREREREREVLLASGKYISNKITISSKRNPLTAPKFFPQKFSLGKSAKFVLLYGPPRKQHNPAATKKKTSK
jgi:hypothetical protein